MVKQEILPGLKIKISTKSYNDERWSHQTIDTTPNIGYEFARNGNWSATDQRLSNKPAVFEFMNTYWDHRVVDPNENKFHYLGKSRSRIPNQRAETTNLELYERELERAIEQAVLKVKTRWNKKLKQDLENHFEDDLVKFVKSK